MGWHYIKINQLISQLNSRIWLCLHLYLYLYICVCVDIYTLLNISVYIKISASLYLNIYDSLHLFNLWTPWLISQSLWNFTSALLLFNECFKDMRKGKIWRGKHNRSLFFQWYTVHFSLKLITKDLFVQKANNIAISRNSILNNQGNCFFFKEINKARFIHIVSK